MESPGIPGRFIDKLSARGQRLLDAHDVVDAHSEFTRWIDEVSRWLSKNFPDSGLAADWGGQGGSNLVMGGGYYHDPSSWSVFRMQVQGRLRWLGHLPTRLSLINLATPARTQNEAKQTGRKEIKLQTVSRAYVDPDRISELKSLSSNKFDLSKLVRMCEELNICFAGECYLAIIMHTRAVIDHVPPIFGCKTFAEVTSSYGGTRSFKEAMANLESSSRKIADHYLHGQIRQSEALPNVTQVDFSNAVDFLLAEIVRVLK